jgi:hypothetical protein
MFETPLIISGPFREPKQMLTDQSYDGHSSIHSDDIASDLGFSGGPIEGPTHFSQFEPLLYSIWKDQWLTKGCFSCHFKKMVVEGEKVRAHVNAPKNGQETLEAWAEKEDGTKILEASASIDSSESLLDKRIKSLVRPKHLVILKDISTGMKTESRDTVIIEPTIRLGDLYPFSLNEKLAKITEFSDFYSISSTNRWKKTLIPIEMVSCLVEYNNSANWPVKKPSIGLYADLEIKMIKGPLFASTKYFVEREIVAISESVRTESFWVKSSVYDISDILVCEVLLNHAVLKNSYPGYKVM